MSDAVFDGIYFFGGKNNKGELLNKLKYLKPLMSEDKILSVDWQKIKQQGIPPCARTGHTMSFLPMNLALIIVGGRNDKECGSSSIPFLDDMHLFLLDQKSWLQVKYVPFCNKLCRLGNHSSTVVSDNESYEKLIIFGGITN